MNRYFIYIAYNGKNYNGWQIQPNGITIQQKVQEALGLLLKSETLVIGAGRTDTGVHARSMVAHFDCEEPIEPSFLVKKLNNLLPKDIAVHKIVPVLPGSHARFYAVSRTYKYYLTDVKDPFYNDYVYRVSRLPNFDTMNQAIQILIETTDFTSFSKVKSEAKTHICRVKHATWAKEGAFWVFTIQADRFLRGMVRAIVGTLLEVGKGKISIADFKKIIEMKDRKLAGNAVPAHALFLEEIEYVDKIFEMTS